MMPTRKCPFCAEIIQSEAKICKHCKKDVLAMPESELTKWLLGKSRNANPAQTEQHTHSSIRMNPKQQNCLIIIIFMVFCIIILQLSSCTSNNSSSSTSSDTYSSSSSGSSSSGDGDTISAFSCAKQIMQRQLKSPSSANFPSIYDGSSATQIDKSGSFYTVNSYVDAQNSFGAKLRTPFECRVNVSGGGCSGSCS